MSSVLKYFIYGNLHEILIKREAGLVLKSDMLCIFANRN